jgi:hypothetical protein
MMMDRQGITYGAEYEFGDIERTALPEGLTWNTKDYSIVSSTGIANDPKGKVYKRGGEINSKPTHSMSEQLVMFHDLILMHPEARVNHRTNLHLHIRVPGLSQQLGTLKHLLSYIDTYQEEIYKLIEPIPEPSFEPQATFAEHRGAEKRHKRRKVSHQYKVPKKRVERAMQAKTVEEFFAAHAPIQANGEPAWGLTTRAGINLLQLKETDTIEFRHFTNTKSAEELASCFLWVDSFIQAVLDGGTPQEIYNLYGPWQFPPFQPYNHAMEIGYSWTNFDKNSRKVAEARIADLANQFDIDNCSASDIAPYIVSQSGGTLAL